MLVNICVCIKHSHLDVHPKATMSTHSLCTPRAMIAADNELLEAGGPSSQDATVMATPMPQLGEEQRCGALCAMGGGWHAVCGVHDTCDRCLQGRLCARLRVRYL